MVDLPEQLVCRTHESIGDIPREQWRRVAGTDAPFLRWSFLTALEETGCVGPGTGWTPRPLTLWRRDDDAGSPDELVAALPMYIKMHSAGEFVFDWGWADAAERAGLAYYPKAVVAVPFTPVPGPRLLVDEEVAGDVDAPDALRRRLVEEAADFADAEGLSSVHFNFVVPEERDLLREGGLPIRVGYQYHWHNGGPLGPEDAESGDGAGYADFDDFLSRLRSKKRSNIKRQRRKLRQKGVEVRSRTGDQLDERDWRRAYAYYRDTVQKFFYGRQYLNEAFFLELGRRMPDQIHLAEALHPDDGEPYAGAVNLMGRGRLFGRYWGSLADIKFTHFDVCFYEGIRWSIDQGLSVFEGGSGGEHKFDRGFMPAYTYSAHYIRHPGLRQAIEDFIGREQSVIESEVERKRREDSPYKRGVGF